MRKVFVLIGFLMAVSFSAVAQSNDLALVAGVKVTPSGSAALGSDDALIIDLAVNPWGKPVPHNDNALPAYISLPAASMDDAVSDNQSNRNAVRQTR